MINRTNKLTALLVAATAVASIAPAVTANAATKLETKEGTIEAAMSFDKGNYIFDGYMSEDDETGLYFNNGSKDSFLEDDTDYDFTGIKYGSKYTVVEEDGDKYLLDLSTGKVDTDETLEDKIDNLQSKVKSTFKKVDRYNVTSGTDVKLTQINENQFGDVWYSYKVEGTEQISSTGEAIVTPAVPSKKEVTIEASSFNSTIKIAGQTFDSGSYDQSTLIEAINGASFSNLKVTAEASGADVKVTLVREGDDAATATEDMFGEFENVTGSSFTQGTPESTTPGQVTKTAEQCYGFVNEAGKYIDASVTANLTVVNGTSTTKVTKFNDEKDGVVAQLTSLKAIAQDENNIYAIATVEITGTKENANDGTKTFVQRISKSQGNKQDDAYLPSKVESYEISADYALDDDSEDFEKAATLLGDLDDANVRVINNVLYITKVDGNNVTVSTVKLTKNKVTKGGEDKKYDLYLATFAEDDDQDIAGENAVSIDAEGNTWALNKGKIYKFNGKEFEEVYGCDRAIDTLDVYNSENLIAWENGEEVFAVAQGKVATDEEDNKEEVTVQNGWVKNADGTWSFYRDNAAVKGQWVQDGNWYYLNANGIMQTGWLNDRGTWYYLNASGAMQTGWVNDRGTWYYMQSSGAMKTGWLNDNGTWYYLNASGAMQTGWFKDTDGRWYFLQSNGAMATNTTVDGYVLGANGAWIR